MKRILMATLLGAACACPMIYAQTAPPAVTPSPPPVPSGPVAAVAPERVESNMLQVMRGLLFPASNVVFAAQGDLSQFKQDPHPPLSPNLLTSVYGGWQAIENASLTLAESANVLLLPGRACANGHVAPVQRADWIEYTKKLRDAGQAAYTAAKTKNQDAMIEVSGVVADSCNACHRVYRRDRQNDTSLRCIPPSQ